MPGFEGSPIQRLTYAQAAEMLGVREITLMRMVHRGDLSTQAKWAKTSLLRPDVERLSLERWRPGSPTWLTATQVAEQLELSPPRVYQLSNAGRLPYEWGPDGRRLFRPQQIAVIARARRRRFRLRRKRTLALKAGSAVPSRMGGVIYRISSKMQASKAVLRLGECGIKARLLPGRPSELPGVWLEVDADDVERGSDA